MSSLVFLDYSGFIGNSSIDQILEKLKGSSEFRNIDKTTAKRTYAILVECLENIVKYAAKLPEDDSRYKPFVLVYNEGGRINVETGNVIPADTIAELSARLDTINGMEEADLVRLYEQVINREIKPGTSGAGLGLIIIKLKSGNIIEYDYSPIDSKFSFLKMSISINRCYMRKLVINKTSSSPEVILDPEKRVFEISGESRPPDVGKFYGEIFNWFDEYSAHLLKSQENTDPFVFNFDLEYFNSSSAKYILDFCKQMALVKSRGKSLEVRWQYDVDDEDMLEAGKEMSRIAKLPFEFVRKENG